MLQEVSVRFQRIFGVFANFVIFAVLLFVPAGTIVWPRAWIFLGVVSGAAAIAIFKIPEDLLRERYGAPFQRGQPLADKLVLPVFLATFVAMVVMIPLDVFRWRLLPSPSFPIAPAGIALFIAGWWIIALAMITNPYAVLVVKRQRERGHHIIDIGPYGIVRHPMYSGFILFSVGMALWLGSYAAAIAAIVPILLIAIRAVMEERFLLRTMPAYAEYKARVSYRLVPRIW